MERIISVTDLVRNAARLAEEVEAGSIFHITRGGRGSMVLLSEEVFEGWMAAIDEMRRPGWKEAWERTSRDIAAGRGRALEDVVKELGLEDQTHPGRRKSAGRTTRSGSAPRRQRTGAARSRTAKRVAVSR